MFGAPERTKDVNEVKYHLPVSSKDQVGVRYSVVDNKVLPNLDHQETLQVYKNRILAELINHTQLFKKPPTLAYLQAITPNWGCILHDGKPQWNQYTIVQHNVQEDPKSVYVDLILTGLFISRSTISPQFSTIVLEDQEDDNRIDIEWAEHPIVPDVEEVSDILLPSDGFIELRDPAVMLKAKMDAKLIVKEAFLKATEAQNIAIELAKKFTSDFDVSDNESMFSEWIGDSGSESGMEGPNEHIES